MLAALGLVLLAGSCSDTESPVLDFEIVEEVVKGTGPIAAGIDSSDLDTYFQATRQSGSQIWVGIEIVSGLPMEAWMLLRHSVALPAESEVLSAVLELPCATAGDYGDQTSQGVAVERLLDPTWYEDTSSGWPLDPTHKERLSPDIQLTIGQCTADTLGTDKLRVELPPDLIATWSADADDNHGVVLLPRGAVGGFKRFVTADIEFTVEYAAAGDTVSVLLPLRNATTIYTLDPEVESDPTGTGDEAVALVGGPFDHRGVLRFDLGGLPESASFHKLELQLRLAADAVSSPSPDEQINIGFHQLVSIDDELLETRPAVGYFIVPLAEATVGADDESLVVDISSFGTAVEDGILIKAGDGFPSRLQFGFHTREAVQAALRPRIELIYTLPPGFRL